MIKQKPVIVLGAGGHARVLIDLLLESNVNVLGIVTPDKPTGTSCFGVKILGGDEVVSTYSPDDVCLVNGVGSLPYKQLRWKIAEDMRRQGHVFMQCIHPKTIVSSDVELFDGVQIMAGAIIQAGTHIGRDTIVNTGANIDHDCNIGSNCHLAPGVVLSGGVDIGDGTHVGTGSVIIEGVSIGKNCVIAAGSVVYKDIRENSKIIQSKNL